jgi:hypothetical protein
VSSFLSGQHEKSFLEGREDGRIPEEKGCRRNRAGIAGRSCEKGRISSGMAAALVKAAFGSRQWMCEIRGFGFARTDPLREAV